MEEVQLVEGKQQYVEVVLDQVVIVNGSGRH